MENQFFFQRVATAQYLIITAQHYYHIMLQIHLKSERVFWFNFGT